MMLRIGFSRNGTLYLDKSFKDNLAKAKSVGMPLGVYYYSNDKSAEEVRSVFRQIVSECSADDGGHGDHRRRIHNCIRLIPQVGAWLKPIGWPEFSPYFWGAHDMAAPRGAAPFFLRTTFPLPLRGFAGPEGERERQPRSKGEGLQEWPGRAPWRGAGRRLGRAAQAAAEAESCLFDFFPGPCGGAFGTLRLRPLGRHRAFARLAGADQIDGATHRPSGGGPAGAGAGAAP